jgi:DNA-binding transcriptional LysR family regulator
MELRQFEVFRAVAEELHFGRAADRLFLGQPTVSQQLRRLEDELGVLLVHRSSRSVRLTPAGTVFLTEVEGILASVERARLVARDAAAGQQGALRIAANYPASRLMLLPLLERLRERIPSMTAKLRELSSGEQLRELRRGDLDLALVYGSVDEPALRSEHLLDVPVVAIVRAAHPLASSGTLDLARLPGLAHSTGFAGGGTIIEDALLEAADRCGIPLRRRPSSADLTGYLLELETTDAIGFSSLPRARQNVANGMRLLRLGPVEPMLGIHAVWRRTEPEPLVNTAIDELLRLAVGHRQPQ